MASYRKSRRTYKKVAHRAKKSKRDSRRKHRYMKRKSVKRRSNRRRSSRRQRGGVGHPLTPAPYAQQGAMNAAP